jgi:hypothetical protein
MSVLSSDEQRTLRRIAHEPFYWIRKHFPEIKEWEDDLSDLIDMIKSVWEESRQNRINLCFALQLGAYDSLSASANIRDYEALQKKQNSHNSTLVFLVDLRGNIVGEVDTGEEIEPIAVMNLSQMREIVTFWLGADFKIFCKGYQWDPRNKHEILRDIKSKRRDRLLSMRDHRAVLNAHYEQCIRDEARVRYWFPGRKNEVLMPTPERLFQRSLWDFLNREVDCIAQMEPMFKDSSRCDVRILDNYDLYFIEIKWIGYCAKRRRDRDEITAEEPTEFGVDRAIDGAYQTKRYIEKNDAIEFDHRIKLGIYLVYDAYSEQVTPIDYGQEIHRFPLLELVEYRLVTHPPSVETKGLAKRKELV